MPGTKLEKLIFSALVLFAKVGQREHVNVQFLEPRTLPPEEISASTTLYISSQKSLDPVRFDFAVYAYDHKPRVLSQPGWRRMVVECEISSVLYPLLAADDRRALRLTIMRLSSRNIEDFPWNSAESIFDWASWSFG
jgi:outer membrane protease